MRAHIIEAGVVVNTVLVHELGPNMIDASLGGSIGDTWDGETFTPPPPPPPAIPQSVTRRQAKQALLLAGILGNVQPAIDAIPDATQRALVQIEWDDSQTFERDRPALLSLAGALGLDDAALDALFVTAAGL
jgi:hypothetical protein